MCKYSDFKLFLGKTEQIFSKQCANLNNLQKQTLQNLIKPVSSRCSDSSIAAATSILFWRRLQQIKAWLLVLLILVLTADFIWASVTVVEMD